ncbi:MAG: polyphosphate kinase 1 [Chlorobi bacterium]|nr:polyphosphate kinase 1 [Chlorobiota bacterium]
MAKEKLIINRELSWLSFNHRVLQEAQNPDVPLVERMRFLGIFSNNLDEFFKVRVASIRRMIELDIKAKKVIGGKPGKILQKIQNTVLEHQQWFEQTYFEIINELKKYNIYLIDDKALSPRQQDYVKDLFHDHVLPALYPVMLHSVRSFPQLKDKSIYLAIKMTSKDPDIKKEYAIIEVPTSEVDRFIILPAEDRKKFIIMLDDVIRFGLPSVFSIFHYDHFEAHTIKITRDAELDIDNDLSKSFLEKISAGIDERKKGQPVRLVYDQFIPRDLLDYLIEQLKLDNLDNIIPGGKYHNFKDFMNFPNIGQAKLEYPPLPQLLHPVLTERASILESIEKKDILIHFPYHKFSYLTDLLREAAIDPDVTHIRITLYRVARESKVMTALINACQNGKDVTVVIELQARFDEASNIYWSRKLGEAGARVFFGIPGLKVHAKMILITKKSGRKKIRYAVISTGNFHEQTARVYSDILLATVDQVITSDAEKVFRFLENPYIPARYRNLIVSPNHMRQKLYRLINQEIKNTLANKPAYIIFKLNNLVDKEIILKLYEASNAGVKITLLVRGICSLIPGVEGMSENIEAYAMIGRYLEHSRIMVFCNGGEEKIYIGSADLMVRNLDHRVEVICPVYDPHIRKKLKDILSLQLSDNVKTRIINKNQDNIYKQATGKKIDSQITLYQRYQKEISKE